MTGFYVRRIETVPHAAEAGRLPRMGWTGPIDSQEQAAKEVAAWQAVGWDAKVLQGDASTIKLVDAWESPLEPQGDALRFAALDMLVRVQAPAWLEAVRRRALAKELRARPALTDAAVVAGAIFTLTRAQSAAYRSSGVESWDQATDGMAALEESGGVALRNLAGFPPMHRAYSAASTAASCAAGVLRYCSHAASPAKRRAVVAQLRVIDPTAEQ